MAELFDSMINSILDRLVPYRQVVRHQRCSDVWFDSDCREAKRLTRRFAAVRNNSNLFPLYQSAYRSNHSTETAVLHVLSEILTAADCGNLSSLVLLDLSAAFDTVDHEILLRRLEILYSITGNAHMWLRS
jgi:Reverse transcriptase (RNA-dependent DNA polymerase)